MRTEEPSAIHLADYKAPEFRITSVHLDFALDPEATRVIAKLEIERLSGRSDGQASEGEPPGRATQNNSPLTLMGENQTLLGVSLDGRALSPSDYLLDDKSLTIANVPARFTLEISSE